MRTLFLKIFFSFWLTIILMGVPFYFLALKNRPEHFSPGMRDFEMQAMARYGDEALAAWDTGGQDGLRAFLDTIERQSGIRLYFFNGSTAVPSDRPAPAKARAKANQIISGAPPQPPGFPSEEKWLGRRLTPQTGHSAAPAPDILVLQLPMPPLPPPLLPLLPPMQSGPWNNILLYSLVGGLVCYFLARSLTAPIRKLREASNRIAHGDFSVRVSPELGHSGREVADLGRDFDTMAERIEELLSSKKQLLRDISHELRSPLARLNVALELARQKAGEDARQPLERIERESGRLNELIGDLLTLTRLENGIQDLGRGEFSLNELLELIVADALYEARHCQVSIREAEPMMLQGSRELMRRALENVVRNAVRYTAENSTVEISLTGTDSTEGKQAMIVIRDHGPGVPDAAFEHLFEPFYRVDNARDRQSGGTGLGLAIAEQAVRLHHGTITAANADQGGLIMTITLPILQKNQEEDRPLSPTRPAS